MIAVYYNYPNSGFSIHEGQTVEESHVHSKPSPRIFHVTIHNITDIVKKITNSDFKFAAYQDVNDLWLEINFDDVIFEKAFAEYVLRLLGKRYKPFQEIYL